MTWKLSEGALATIMRGGTVEDPVMQILGSKRIAGAGSSERYRLLVSDGCHLNSFAMLATQLNDKLTSGELSDYSVVRMNRLITSMVNNGGRGEKRVMIILDLTILAKGTEVGMKIGNPVAFPDGGSSAAATPAPTKPAVASPAQSRPQANGTMAPAPTQLTRPQVRNNAAQLSSPADGHIFPIASLSPYQNKWVIKARVVNKTPIKTWSNARGEGKLFSMELVDESGEIRATAFKEQCDKFFDLIEVDRVYFISRCQLKPANKKFTSVNNDYEMTFTGETTVVPCHEDVTDIPHITFNFVPLNKLAETDLTAIVDVIGVLKAAGGVEVFTARTTNREMKKREVTIVDQSNTAMALTLWGEQAEEFSETPGAVLAVKGVKQSDFGGGRSASVLMSSTLQVNPDIPEAHRLRGWYDSVGHSQEHVNISAKQLGAAGSGGLTPWATLLEIRDKQMGSGEKADYCQTKATITTIRSENCMYMSCAGENCNKKVIDMNNGMYRCEKCNRDYPGFKYRFLMSVCIGDWSGQQWVTCFQDTAEALLDMKAEQFGEIFSDKAQVQAIVNNATFKSFVFKLRVKFETFNDETRLKVVVMNLRPVDVREYCMKMISEIKTANGMS
ncbi:replication protein A 70 kDa DNA-binding subunit [Schistocerca americana]|uniref:replication protein A 70 kDa DNA-binding subunit n=1 Tax=Schistocerca americana TaxID=7009 RepID=UPI001F4FB79E|nr:replication protein A 70 kDa DNA-binding subunit [Schistocerca americana]